MNPSEIITQHQRAREAERAASRADLYKWWARRVLEGDHEACAAMFTSPNSIVWA